MRFLPQNATPAPDGLVRADQPFHSLGEGLLKLLDRLVLALGDEGRHARGQPQQLEQCLEGREVPLLRALDMLEVDQLVERQGGQRGQVSGVEPPAGDGEHKISRIDQGRQQHHGPFRLEAESLCGEVFDAELGLDQFTTVKDLAVALLSHPFQDVIGIF